MESDIKCLECGKITRKFELGKLFYDINKPLESMIILNSVICQKCKIDISNEKFSIKSHEILMKFVVSNLGASIGDVPNHLRDAYPVNKEEYNKMKIVCKSKPKLVNKF